MKKILLVLTVLLGCTLTISAQKQGLNYKHLCSIPSYFTYNQVPVLYESASAVKVGDNYVYNLYDLNFDHVATVSVESRPVGVKSNMKIEKVIDKTGVTFSMDDNDVALTQTFFNDDEDWEYIVPVGKEEPTEWGVTMFITESYDIKKTDGTVVGTISKDWNLDIHIINDVVYTTISKTDESTGKSIYYYYTIPEFRKLLGGTNDVNAVPAMIETVDDEAYDLLGRKIPENQKGIVVKNGAKLYNK